MVIRLVWPWHQLGSSVSTGVASSVPWFPTSPLVSELYGPRSKPPSLMIVVKANSTAGVRLLPDIWHCLLLSLSQVSFMCMRLLCFTRWIQSLCFCCCAQSTAASVPVSVLSTLHECQIISFVLFLCPFLSHTTIDKHNS